MFDMAQYEIFKKEKLLLANPVYKNFISYNRFTNFFVTDKNFKVNYLTMPFSSPPKKLIDDEDARLMVFSDWRYQESYYNLSGNFL